MGTIVPQAMIASVVNGRTALKSASPITGMPIFVYEGGRSGTFIWQSGNFSSNVTADTQEGIYIASSVSGYGSSVGAWVRQYYGPADVRWFGAVGDGVADDQAALNASTTICRHVYVPNGTYRITQSWVVPSFTHITAQTTQAIIQADFLSGAILKGNLSGVDRNYWLTIELLRLVGKNSGGNLTDLGLDLNNWTFVTTRGIFINSCVTGMRHGGAGQSAYYNDHHDSIITDCSACVANGYLGNEIKFFGGKWGNCVLGASEDNTSGICYFGVSVEVFTLAAFLVANNGNPCVATRYIGCRTENPVSGYDSSVHYSLKAQAYDTTIVGPGASGGGTKVANSGTRTNIVGTA